MSLRLVDDELTSTIAHALRARSNVKKVLLEVAKDDTCVLDYTKRTTLTLKYSKVN